MTETDLTPADDVSGARGERERITALHQQMSDQVAALTGGPEWTAWLTAAARFHDYSFGNVMLILAQRPEATAVAGYQRWKHFGRHVDRGQKGIPILAPVVRRTDRDAERQAYRAADRSGQPAGSDRRPAADAGPAPAAKVRVAGYRITHVWDVAQTSGTPLPEQPRPRLLTGQAPPGLWDALAGVVTDHGYTLQRGDCGAANGLTKPATRTVRVRADVDDAQAVKTLAHELGHVLLHTTDPGQRTLPACRGTTEVEAESLALIVATSHGMDTSAYTFPYLASWASSVKGLSPEEVIRATGQRVVTAAHDTLMRLQPPGPARATTSLDPTTRVHAGARRTAALRQAVTIPAPVTGRPAVAADRGTLTGVHLDALRFFRGQAPRSSVPAYLEARALPMAAAAPWAAGYAPASWTGLTPAALRSLEAHLAGRTTGPIFATTTGRAMDRTAAWRLLRRLATTAGIPAAHRISPHSLRHTFATTALDAGVPLRDVQDSMGHADPRTTRLYDRTRASLDRNATYAVAARLAQH